MSDEARLTALLAEYELLRQESLDTLGHRLTVVNFTFASLSVVVAGLLTSDQPSWVLAAVAIVFVPQGAKAGLLIWLGEYARSQRAGRHLSELEVSINRLTGAPSGEGMSWESQLTSRGTHMSLPYRATIAFTVGVGWVAAALGLSLFFAALSELSIGTFSRGGILLLVCTMVLAVEVVFLRTFLREWVAARTGTTPAGRNG